MTIDYDKSQYHAPDGTEVKILDTVLARHRSTNALELLAYTSGARWYTVATGTWKLTLLEVVDWQDYRLLRQPPEEWL